MKQQILDRLNELIEEEHGVPVTMDSKFIDAELDSLGTVITLACLEADYPFWKDVPKSEDAIAMMDIPNLTIRELIRQCVLSTSSTSQEPTDKSD